MSSRRSTTNFNLSGFSPIQLNIGSPSSSYKSPAGKDYGINERLETGRDKIISGFERWKTAENNGFHILNIIHSLKEKARLSEQSKYPQELENYCNKLCLVRQTLEDVIKSIEGFGKEVSGSLGVLSSFRDENEELKNRLDIIRKFVDLLLSNLISNLEKKVHVIENIAHTTSSNESHILMISWNNDETQNKIFKLVVQLKVSPLNERWKT